VSGGGGVYVVEVRDLRCGREGASDGGSRAGKLCRLRVRGVACGSWSLSASGEGIMIRKLKSGEYRLYSRKKNPKTGKRRNLGTFDTRAGAEKHERAVQYFKRGG
jgi:hypothetical protein